MAGNNTYNSTANTSWTAPQNGQFLVEAWGGGGGGGANNRSGNNASSGGGGGAYASSVVTCVKDTVYTIGIGGGGANGNNRNNGSPGGNTHFNNNEVKAGAGQGGQNSGTTGGAGGTVANSIGTVRNAGGAGGLKTATGIGGGGGAAGSSAGTGPAGSGQTGGTGNNGGGSGGGGGGAESNGSNGTIAGGGGGGAGNNASLPIQYGGNGANGQIIIYWNDIISGSSSGVAAVSGTLKAKGKLSGTIQAVSPLETNLLSLWELNETSGNAIDYKSLNNLSPSNCTQNVSGKLGTCYTFNGTSSYLGSIDAYRLTTNFSFSVWIKTSGTASKAIITNYYSGVGENGYDLMMGADGTIEWSVRNDSYSPAEITIISTGTVNNGAWHHVVCTFDGTYARIYIDGAADGVSSAWNHPAFIHASSLFNIGRREVGYNWNGEIDQTAIWDTVLSLTQAQEIYNSSNGKATPWSVTLVAGDLKNKVSTGPSGIVSGTSSVSGALKAKGKLYGTITGVASLAGILRAKGKLYGTTAGIATLAGLIKGKGKLYGTIAGVSTIAGLIKAKGKLYGLISGVASVVGTMKVIIFGTSSGIASVVGIIRAKGKLYGIIAGVATIIGNLKAKTFGPSGTIASVATVSGTIKAKGKIVGVIISVTSVSVVLKGKGKLVGIINGTTVTVVILRGKGKLAGQSSSQTTINAVLLVHLLYIGILRYWSGSTWEEGHLKANVSRRGGWVDPVLKSAKGGEFRLINS